jgi:RsiW-degrading membrane proteinase PrsW (M82 family)
MVLLVAVAVLPPIALLALFYLVDRYEPEPRRYVLAAFLLGAVSMGVSYVAAQAIASAVTEEWLALGGVPARAFESFVIAGGVEEGAKWIAFVAIIYRWRELDEPMDGLVYGAALALGFATVENTLYVANQGLRTGLLRAVFAVPAHALFGATMGGLLGRAKLGAGRSQTGAVPVARRNALIALALLAPVLAHGLYDFLLLTLVGSAMYAAVTAVSVMLWIEAVRRIRSADRDSPFRH